MSQFACTTLTQPAFPKDTRPKHCSCLVVAPNRLSAGSFTAIFPKLNVCSSSVVFPQLNFPATLDKWSDVAFFGSLISASNVEAAIFPRDAVISTICWFSSEVVQKTSSFNMLRGMTSSKNSMQYWRFQYIVGAPSTNKSWRDPKLLPRCNKSSPAWLLFIHSSNSSPCPLG